MHDLTEVHQQTMINHIMGIHTQLQQIQQGQQAILRALKIFTIAFEIAGSGKHSASDSEGGEAAKKEVYTDTSDLVLDHQKPTTILPSSCLPNHNNNNTYFMLPSPSPPPPSLSQQQFPSRFLRQNSNNRHHHVGWFRSETPSPYSSSPPPEEQHAAAAAPPLPSPHVLPSAVNFLF